MTRQLSTNPQAVRARMRKRERVLEQDVELYTQGMRKPLSEWDFEELAHGRPRASDGTFRGMPPRYITTAITREAQRRFKAEAFRRMQTFVGPAMEVLLKVLSSTELDDDGRPIVDMKTRIDVAKFIIEHVMGKATNRVEVEMDNQARGMLARALMMPDGTGGYQPAHDVIEGEYEDEDDDSV